MKLLDLFSGIGGFSLGLERAGFETITFCEIEEFPRKVLAKHWPDVPIVGDIKKLTYKNGVLYDDGKEVYRGAIDALCGGYPCQPFSVAGKRRGENDDRHLWPEYFRLIREIRPSWIIGENVAGHVNMGLDNVLSDLESEGYAWEAFVIPACALGAYHRRDRVWIIANPEKLQRNGGEHHGENSGAQVSESGSGSSEKNMANTMLSGLQGRQEAGNFEGGREERDKQSAGCGECSKPGNRFPEPRMGRGLDGFSSWLDCPDTVPRITTVQAEKGKSAGRAHRLKGLGNAVVPQIPEIIGRAIIQLANN